MADKKISALTGAATPLAGTEVLPIVQGGTTVKVSAADITAGRNVSMANATVGSGGSGAVSTGIVLEGSSNAAYGAFIQGKRGGSGAWLTGDYSSAFGSGDGYLVFGYSTNPIVFHSQSNGELLRLTGTNVQATSGNLVFGTNGKGIVTNTAGQITQNAFSGFTSGVAKVISPAKSSGFMVFVTGYSLSGGYSAILNYGDTISVVSALNTTGGTVAFTSVSNQLNVTTTGTASQILQELWVSVIGK